MRSAMGWLASVFTTLTLLAAAACANLNTTEIAQITSGEKSAVILAYKRSHNFAFADVKIQNVVSRRVYTFLMNDTEKGIVLGLQPVEAGRYRVIFGDFGFDARTTRGSLINYWFNEFTVAKGEIVDLGTLSIDPIVVHSDGSWVEVMKNFPFSLSSEQERVYLTYSLDDTHDARVQDMLSAKYPSLIPLCVKRPLEMAFAASEFRQIVEDAFKPRADGSLRGTLEAQITLSQRLQTLFRTNHPINEVF